MNLLEVTASTILVAVLLLASVKATTGMVGNQAIADAQLEAEWVADDWLAEIASMPFDLTAEDRTIALAEPSRSLRAGKVEMTDYDGMIQSPPTRADGASITRLSRWSTTVSVTDVSPNSPDTAITTEAGQTPMLRRILVTMIDESGVSFTRTRLVSRHAIAGGQAGELAGAIDALGRIHWHTNTGSQTMFVPLFNLPAR